MSLTPEQLLFELDKLVATLDAEQVASPELRAKLSNAAKKASLALERPTDVVTRILLSNPVESTLVHIALNLELFPKLVEPDRSPKSLASLVEVTGADSALLERILSGLAAFGAVKEVGHDAYALSPSYESLANAAFGHAVANCSNFLNPAYQALPTLLESTKYQNPTDPNNTAVQEAFGYTDTSLLGILAENPQAAHGFGTLMNTWGEGHALLQHLYPVKERLVDTFDQRISPILFVDVGGGYGQKSIALKADFPRLPGRIIVQDLDMTIERAPKSDGIEMQAHDFLSEQPIRGAKAYYIRQCLHNWPDDACIQILGHLGQAMVPGYSKLLIHEQIVPESGAGQWVTVQDVNMMALCGVAERSEKTWKKLIGSAGLTLEKVYISKDGVSESVLEVTRI